MSGKPDGPERIAEGVKCPYCLWGHFRLRSRVSDNGTDDGAQRWFWKCSSDELLKCRTTYDPDYSELARTGGYWAVVDGRVKAVHPPA